MTMWGSGYDGMKPGMTAWGRHDGEEAARLACGAGAGRARAVLGAGAKSG